MQILITCHPTRGVVVIDHGHDSSSRRSRSKTPGLCSVTAASADSDRSSGARPPHSWARKKDLSEAALLTRLWVAMVAGKPDLKPQSG
jgi:hypothetical protein